MSDQEQNIELEARITGIGSYSIATKRGYKRDPQTPALVMICLANSEGPAYDGANHAGNLVFRANDAMKIGLKVGETVKIRITRKPRPPMAQ